MSNEAKNLSQAIAFAAGVCFLGTARFTQSGIQDVQGALFIIIAENTFIPMYSVLHMFPEEFPMLHRELKAGLYSTPVYYLSRMLALVSKFVYEIIFLFPFFYLLSENNVKVYYVYINKMIC